MKVLNCLSRWRVPGAAAVLLGALLAALLISETPLMASDEAKAPALPPDLAKVPSDAAFIVSLRVADLWNSDWSKSVRKRWDKEANASGCGFENQFGLPIDQVERLTIVALNVPTRSADPLSFGRTTEAFVFHSTKASVVRTTKAFDRYKVFAAIGKAKKEKYKDQTFYVRRKNPTIYPLDEPMLVYGDDSTALVYGDDSAAIRAFIDFPAKKDGSLAGALRLAAGNHSVVFGLNVKAFNYAVSDKLPGEIELFQPLLQALSGTLTVDLGAESRVDVKLTFATEKDAKKGLKSARNGLDLARVGVERSVTELSKQKEMGKFVELLKRLQESLKATQVEQEGKTLRASVRLKLDAADVRLALLEVVQKIEEMTALPNFYVPPIFSR